MMNSTAYHEAAHAVAARALGLPVVYLSIRPKPDESGRARLDTSSADFAEVDDLSCAIIKVAGEVAVRMLGGSTTPTFNWLEEEGDAEDARHFIARMDGDELDNRHLATFRAYALLRTRWSQVEAVASNLEREKVLTGEEVAKLCAAEERGADVRASTHAPSTKPKPVRPPLRAVRSGGVERRPFTITVQKGGAK